VALSDEIDWAKMRDALAFLTKDHCNGGHGSEIFVSTKRGASETTLICVSREHWSPITLRTVTREQLREMGLLKR
jgi:hypothetical protein